MGHLVQSPLPGLAQGPPDFDQAQWLLDHTALLNEQQAHWETSGYDVFVERQNSFQLRGQSATLAGRPDLLVVVDDQARIIDVKSAREHSWHTIQIKIYQYAMPRALPQFRLDRLACEVGYTTYTARVPCGALPTPTAQPPTSIKGDRRSKARK